MHKVTIAGPGAGKTTSLVDTILDDLPKLNPYRYMAVITYTNAATENIQQKLRSRLNIPNNLFIGTIHSFLIRFVLHPYGFITNHTPQNKKYIDQAYGRMRNDQEKERVRDRANDLVQKGLITYDKVLEISHKILSENPRLTEILAYRLQFLFVDEYQDSRLYQHQIIRLLMRDCNKVELIGDPLQSIYGFQYELTQLHNEPTPSGFDKTPIKLTLSMNDVEVIHNRYNYRSTNRIVEFLNKLDGDRQDLNDNHPEHNHEVYFISDIESKAIVTKFQKLVDDLQLLAEDNVFYKLMLGRTWGILRHFEDTARFIQINNKQEFDTSAFASFKRVVIAILGTSLVRILGDHKISRVQFRAFVLELLFELKSFKRDTEPLKSLLTYNDDTPFHKIIVDSWNRRFPHAKKSVEDTNHVKIAASLIGCLTSSSTNDMKQEDMLYSTIHGAKGLEATAVLIVAESKTWGDKITANEYLQMWLSSDKECDDDETRCGFVAFSRARKLLVLSSLNEISNENRERLLELGVKII